MPRNLLHSVREPLLLPRGPLPALSARRAALLPLLSTVAAAGLLLSSCGEAAPNGNEFSAGMGDGTPRTGGAVTTPAEEEATVPGAARAEGETNIAATPPQGGEGMVVVTAPAGGLGAGESTEGSAPPATCALPTSFRWTSSQPVISPQPPAGRNFASIKDPTVVFYQGKYHVFATVYETTEGAAGWKSVYTSFSDFAEADAAPQIYMPNLPTGSTVAPEVFYFAPQNLWYLIYQWGARYSTNADINNPNGWSAPRPLLSGEPTGALDFWVICDDVNCHMFFSRDDGVLYRSKTALGNFPNFSGYDIVMQAPSAGLLFEASNVYKVDGTNQYLLLVEAYGPRYFRSWTSESLDGPWAPLADTQQNPFAGAANVGFEGNGWTNDISHGEMLRSGFDQQLTINACKLQYLYQGTAPNFTGDYNSIPYRLGLLTQQ